MGEVGSEGWVQRDGGGTDLISRGENTLIARRSAGGGSASPLSFYFLFALGGERGPSWKSPTAGLLAIGITDKLTLNDDQANG